MGKIQMAVQKLKTGNRARQTQRKECKSTNPYLQDLCKLYAYLVRRAPSKNNVMICKSIMASNRNKMPISLKTLVSKIDGDKVLVVPSTVTEDARQWNIPKMTVCALRFTETARARIVAEGGSCITFDQLAKMDTYAENVVIVKGDFLKRMSRRYMGLAPGHKFSSSLERLNRRSNKVLDRSGADNRGSNVAGNRLARA